MFPYHSEKSVKWHDSENFVPTWLYILLHITTCILLHITTCYIVVYITSNKKVNDVVWYSSLGVHNTSDVYTEYDVSIAL